VAWPIVALGGYAAYQAQHDKSNTNELTASNEGLSKQIKGLKAELAEAQKLNERRKDYDDLKGQLEVVRARKEAADSQRDDALKKAEQSAALAASNDSSQKAEIQMLQRSVAALRQQLADAHAR
jgi:Tfp pilus assembly protein PilN